MKTKQEKLEKINQEIENKKQLIEKCRQDIKNLNAKKKKIELEISKEQHKDLCSYLAELGISSTTALQEFLDNYVGREDKVNNAVTTEEPTTIELTEETTNREE